MRSRRRLLAGSESPREIWPAFTDVMSTLAIILFVLVLLSYVRSLVAAKQLEAFERQIAASEKELGTLQAQIEVEQGQLRDARTRAQQQEATIAASDRELGTLRDRLRDIAVLRVSGLSVPPLPMASNPRSVSSSPSSCAVSRSSSMQRIFFRASAIAAQTRMSRAIAGTERTRCAASWECTSRRKL